MSLCYLGDEKCMLSLWPFQILKRSLKGAINIDQQQQPNAWKGYPTRELLSSRSANSPFPVNTVQLGDHSPEQIAENSKGVVKCYEVLLSAQSYMGAGAIGNLEQNIPLQAIQPLNLYVKISFKAMLKSHFHYFNSLVILLHSAKCYKYVWTIWKMTIIWESRDNSGTKLAMASNTQAS